MRNQDFIYGRNPVLELLKDGKQAERVFLQRGIEPAFASEIKKLASDLGVPVALVPKAKMDRITRKNHQGVVAFSSVVEYQPLEPVVQLSYEKGEVPLILLLDGVTDVRNVGAIARSAEVFGVTALAVPMRGSAMINADTVKTSAGAIRHLNVCRVKSIHKSCELLQKMGFVICVADQKASTGLDEIDFSGPTAIVLGSEDQGVYQAIKDSADHVFAIPQLGRTDSLNVSVASGVILYEVTRQRKTK